MKLRHKIARALVPVVIVVVAVLLSAALMRMRPEVEPEPPEVRVPLVATVSAAPDQLELTVRTHGTVVPRTESGLVTEVSGRVVEVSPSLVNGGFFDEGEVLLTIEATDYELALEDARLALARAERMLAQEEADASVARRDWESMGRGEAPPLVLREPQLAEARAEVGAARARMERALRDLERTRVRAPFPGRVRSERVDPGQFVQRGEELARVYAVDFAEVRLPLSDAELAYLDLPLVHRGDPESFEGPEVELRTRFAGAEHAWHGRIVRTEGEIDPETRMVVAVARVEDPYGPATEAERPPLAVGLFVEAEISGRTVEGYALPREALRDTTVMWVVEDGDTLRVRDVEVFKRERDRVLVTSGLAPGEAVVVSPLETAVDGMTVQVAGEPAR